MLGYARAFPEVGETGYNRFLIDSRSRSVLIISSLLALLILGGCGTGSNQEQVGGSLRQVFSSIGRPDQSEQFCSAIALSNQALFTRQAPALKSEASCSAAAASIWNKQKQNVESKEYNQLLLDVGGELVKRLHGPGAKTLIKNQQATLSIPKEPGAPKYGYSKIVLVKENNHWYVDFLNSSADIKKVLLISSNVS